MNEIIIIILAWYESQSLRTPRLLPPTPLTTIHSVDRSWEPGHVSITLATLPARERHNFRCSSSKKGEVPRRWCGRSRAGEGGCCNRQTASSQKEIWTAAGGSCSFLPFAWRVHLCVMRAIFREPHHFSWPQNTINRHKS